MEGWKQTLADLVSDRGWALKRHAFLLCGNDSQAEELVQEALVRAFARPLRAPRSGRAEAYVRAIMVNLFIDGERRRRRWNKALPELTAPDSVPDMADRIAAHDALMTGLRGLTRRQRACVVLRYYQDLPVAGVASVLGVSDGAVKRYLSEALRRLETELASYHEG